MSQSTSAAERAERLTRRRARMMPVLALFLVIQQAAFLTAGNGMRAVDIVRTAGWLVLATVILGVLVTGGFWFKSPQVRELMEDDVTRSNRGDALTLGFTFAIGTGVVLYGVEFFAPSAVSAREAIHLIVTFSLAAALLRFGMLERRAIG